MPERVSDADRALIQRMEAELALAERLRQFVTAHLAAVYKLQPGDRVEDDGTIVRGVAAEGGD